MLLLSAISADALTWSAMNGVTADTLLRYRCDEGSGTVLEDLSAGAHDGSLANASAWSSGHPGWFTYSYGFYLSPSGNPTDGMNANVTITGVDMDKGLTVSFWYRNGAGETQSGTAFAIEGPGATPRIQLYTDDFGPSYYGRIRLFASPDWSSLYSIGGEGVWKHIAVVYDPVDGDSSNGGNFYLYLDTALLETVASANDYSGVSQFNFKFGDNTFANSPLQGADLDELLIENAVITDFSQPYHPVNIPTLSEWGMIILTGLVLLVAARRLLGEEPAYADVGMSA
ncbi:MAG: IPTL-CTERM sorting domain-containing protein [Verrucomicrobia bacterium]|nr:IPTL-CTERM sorting domain-containing protein [Verrucomicrobiota bacterium]